MVSDFRIDVDGEGAVANIEIPDLSIVNNKAINGRTTKRIDIHDGVTRYELHTCYISSVAGEVGGVAEIEIEALKYKIK